VTGILYRDLDHRLPCIVSHDTHVFVCDGYKGDFLHFNLGWYGNFNGYYRLKLGNYAPAADGSLILIKNVFAHIEPQREDMVREINMEQPGTLQQMLTTEEQSQVTTLKINGPLNSADIRLLRKMAGADKQPVFADGWQGGALCELDLQNAIITGDDTPYLTMRATGSWTQRVRAANNVKKVFPYAKLAGAKMQEYDSILAHVDSKAERNRLMKQAEQEITDQYTAELKNLTITQGLILVRLIDRETGNTSYQVVQELRGKVRAFFYQGFARLWGYNLKEEYDPHNNPEDDEIETIMTLLERGVI
jgi:hypothetical protein